MRAPSLKCAPPGQIGNRFAVNSPFGISDLRPCSVCGMIRATWASQAGWVAMPSIALRLALVLLVVIAPGIAAAADLPQQAPPTTAPAAYVPAVPDWIVTIGAEGRIIPAFPGAADKKLGWSALPLFSIRQAGTPPDFFGPRDSFSFSLINTPMFQFGPAAAIHQSAQGLRLCRAVRAGRCRLRRPGRRLRQFLAGLVAAPAWRGPARHRRRNRRHR